jgi:uncharacterized protein
MLEISKELVKSIREGNVSKFYELASLYPNLLNKTEQGIYPINVAINFEITEIIDFLFDKGVDINPKSDLTPFMVAMDKERFDMAKRLLEKGADIKIRDDFEKNAWERCVEKSLLSSLNFMLEYCSDDLDIICFVQMRKEEVAIEKVLLQNDDYIKNKGGLLLYYCCYLQMEKLFAVLKNKKADLTYVDPSTGDTLLHATATNSNLYFIKILISYLDINTLNFYHQTPLLIASADENWDVVQLLIENNADKNTKDEHGMSALDYAIGSKCEKYINLLN